MNPLVLIPARMAASRLPGKPMADIHGVPMIVHVWRRATEAAIGEVVVATDTAAVAEAILAAGGRAVMTRADHPSGSDRIAEALEQLDPRALHDVIVNVQGDLPTIAPSTIGAVLAPMADPAVDLATLVAEIRLEHQRTASSVVKMVGTTRRHGHFRCLYFTCATAPWGGRIAVASHRTLCVAARGAGALRRPCPLGARTARKAGTVAGTGRRHAHRSYGRGRCSVGGGHARGPGACAGHAKVIARGLSWRTSAWSGRARCRAASGRTGNRGT